MTKPLITTKENARVLRCPNYDVVNEIGEVGRPDKFGFDMDMQNI